MRCKIEIKPRLIYYMLRFGANSTRLKVNDH